MVSNMLTPKQIRIFEAFLKRPYKEYTYAELKTFSDKKSNSLIQTAISAFLEEDLIIKRKIGNMFLYRLNLHNSTVFSYFDILQKENFSKLLQRTIKIIKEELNIAFISIVIFGSYAQGTNRKDSDLDIAVFVSSDKDKKQCELSFKSAELKSILALDCHVFTKNEMLQMLRDKDENLGKQIAKKHIAIHNPMIFYSILNEGIDNGFQVIYSQVGK